MARKTHQSPEAAKNAILDAAESILTEVGPAGLRISAVAKNARMAHPNIIHHFGSRDGLINAVAQRLGERATARITQAIDDALSAAPEDRVAAITRVLETSYPGDEGRAAVWLHLSGAESSLKSHMTQIVELSHRLRQNINSAASKENTNRLVLLITLALIGEVISGESIKSALGFGSDDDSRANFKQWLAEILLTLNDGQLDTSLNNNALSKL
ncbi:MAG: TetR/AcrR family transcriptional regulator [Acidiferrobacterales bacterium]|nr:TetR/AcrR family transcriptional regulator [Acidiferrobacterales bacterium]